MSKLKTALRICLCVISKIYMRLRFRSKKLNKWHISATYHCRPYKKKIVDLVNTINPDIVIEIGCGIGEICGRVNPNEVYGIDLDPEAIRVANIINNGPQYIVENPLVNKKSFNHFLSSLPYSKRKVFVAVNFLHALNFDLVKDFVLNVINTPNSYLIIDKYSRKEFCKKNRFNKFNHDCDKLFGNDNYIFMNKLDEVRDLILVNNKSI